MEYWDNKLWNGNERTKLHLVCTNQDEKQYSQ